MGSNTFSNGSPLKKNQAKVVELLEPNVLKEEWLFKQVRNVGWSYEYIEVEFPVLTF